MSFLTSRNDIGEDAMLYFKNMSISNINGEYDRLLVAPFKFKSRLIKMMEEQIEEAEKVVRPVSS